MGLIVGKIPEGTTTIDENMPLNPGDIVELYFDVLGDLQNVWLRSLQSQWIESRLEQPYNGWEVLSYQNTETQLIVVCKITKQKVTNGASLQRMSLAVVGAIVITAIVIATAIFGKSVFDFLKMVEVRKREQAQMETPVGQLGMVLEKAGIGTIGIGLIALVLFLFLKK